MKFIYYAKNNTGEEKRGEMDAKDRFDLARILRQEGYILISCNQNKKIKKEFSIPILDRVSIAEKIIFSRNLGVMISAGLPISKAVNILSRQTKNKKFKKVMNSITENIQKGNSLSDSMKKYKSVFSDIFVAMVRVGEETGKLSDSLKIMSNQMENDYNIRKKVKGAMIYPAIIIIVMIAIGIIMMVVVVPNLVSVFEELGSELPLSTKIIISISDFIINNKFTALFSLLGFISFFTWFIKKTKAGKSFIEIISLKTPIVSSLVKKMNCARTSRTMAALIGSGVSILESLDITREVVQNNHYRKVILKAKDNIQKGESLSDSFKESSDLYPILFGEMLAVGEETGKLSDMLYQLAIFYESEVSDTTKNMASIIEPFLMVLIGIAVGFFAISMITPMYSVMSEI